MNTIQKLMAFINTVDYGSFTKAAEIMNYSQSGISHMIKDLEKEWGIALLDRDRAGVRITSDGLTLLPNIRRTCNEYNQLQRKVDDVLGVQTGIIRIGSFVSAAIQWLPNIITKFQENYPNVKYELKLGNYQELEEMIWEGTLDCAFLPLPTHYEMDTIFLETDKYYVVMPKGHPLTAYGKVPYLSLLYYPFLLMKDGSDSEVEAYFKKHNLNVPIYFTTWDDYVTMSLVEAGIGITILSETILKSCPFDLEKRELDVPLTRSLGLVLRNRKTTTTAVKHFIDYLKYRNI